MSPPPPPTGGTPLAGAREVIYRLTIDASGAITAAPDGSDTISGFTLGTDNLTFVDTDGTAPAATTSPDASAVDVLMTAIGAAGGVSLVFDGTNYTGITFGVVAADSVAVPPVDAVTLTVNFAGDGLDQAGLIAALADTTKGGDDTITDAATLAKVFTDGVPSGGSATAPVSAALNATGLALIDTLFGDEISIDTTLPAELL